MAERTFVFRRTNGTGDRLAVKCAERDRLRWLGRRRDCDGAGGSDRAIAAEAGFDTSRGQRLADLCGYSVPLYLIKNRSQPLV
jgi:hypothetical protein